MSGDWRGHCCWLPRYATAAAHVWGCDDGRQAGRQREVGLAQREDAQVVPPELRGVVDAEACGCTMCSTPHVTPFGTQPCNPATPVSRVCGAVLQ